MQVGVDDKCMHTNFGGYGLSGFRVQISERGGVWPRKTRVNPGIQDILDYNFLLFEIYVSLLDFTMIISCCDDKTWFKKKYVFLNPLCVWYDMTSDYLIVQL